MQFFNLDIVVWMDLEPRLGGKKDLKLYNKATKEIKNLIFYYFMKMMKK